MRALLNRTADRLLNRFAPEVRAAAACAVYNNTYCFCRYGISYRQVCYTCRDSVGDAYAYCTSCQASGTC